MHPAIPVFYMAASLTCALFLLTRIAVTIYSGRFVINIYNARSLTIFFQCPCDHIADSNLFLQYVFTWTGTNMYCGRFFISIYIGAPIIDMYHCLYEHIGDSI